MLLILLQTMKCISTDLRFPFRMQKHDFDWTSQRKRHEAVWLSHWYSQEQGAQQSSNLNLVSGLDRWFTFLLGSIGFWIATVLSCNMACHSHMVKEGVCNWFQTMTNKGHIPTYVSLYDYLHISTPTYRDISTVICWYIMIQKNNDISLIIGM